MSQLNNQNIQLLQQQQGNIQTQQAIVRQQQLRGATFRHTHNSQPMSIISTGSSENITCLREVQIFS